MPDAILTPETIAAESPLVVLVAVGLLARMAGAVAASALPIVPGLSLRIRMALVIALSLVAFPAALTAELSGGSPAAVVPSPLVVLGEALIGLMMGTAVALVIGSAGWAGGILGSVSGLSWADDFDPATDQRSAGMDRLAWWIGLGAFFVGGGQLVLVAGLLDSVRAVPIGAAWAPGDAFVAALVGAVSVALRLAVGLAAPALVAVLAFHLATAICMRTMAFAPGPGLLQALASLVLLAAVYAGADAWAGGFGRLVHDPVAACLGGR
jgi:flagellar biosynthesis protein FliR